MRFAILTLLGTAALAAAQCRQVQYVPHAYAQPYVQPYVQTYTPTYYQQYEIIKPVAVATFIVPNSFYQVAPELADARIKQQIADDAAERAINKLMESLRQQQQQQGGTGPAPPLAAPQSKEHPSSLTTKVQTMVNAQCLTCHHGPGSKNLTLDVRDVTKISADMANRMVSRTTLLGTDEGSMPPGKGLEGQPYNDLAHWAYELGKKERGGVPKTIPPANNNEYSVPPIDVLKPEIKAPPKPMLPTAPPVPMDKAKDKGEDLSFLNPASELDKKKRPKPRPRPIG